MNETADTDEETESSIDHPATKVLRDWILVVAIALGAAFLVRIYVLQQFYISGPSMESTLFQDNRVLVNKLSYRLHSIHRGDVVVFDRVTTSGGVVAHDDLIKRVIGVAGDTVEIRQCDVIVNGSEIDEPYLDPTDLAQAQPVDRCRVVDMEKQTVPAHQVFVMGDNRPESFDSRSFGTVPTNLVIGRAFAVVWPLRSFKGL